MSSGIFKDLTGLVFDRLTIIERSVNKNNKVMWKCICSCGNTLDVRADSFNLLKPNTRSCGCLQKEKARENGKKSYKGPEIKIITDIFSAYRNRAKINKVPFELNKQDLKDIIFNNCYYCNIEPINKFSHPKYKDQFLLYNGIDRIIPELGYVKENLRPCCIKCNTAKLDYSEKEFYNWLEICYNNLKNKGMFK